MSDESPLDRFERLAAQFHRETGMMAPGKDVAAMAGDSHSFSERWEAWDAWLKRPIQEAP
jgi:hypothetical protein